MNVSKRIRSCLVPNDTDWLCTDRFLPMITFWVIACALPCLMIMFYLKYLCLSCLQPKLELHVFWYCSWFLDIFLKYHTPRLSWPLSYWKFSILASYILLLLHWFCWSVFHLPLFRQSLLLRGWHLRVIPGSPFCVENWEIGGIG